jgi:hypothetical protein
MFESMKAHFQSIYSQATSTESTHLEETEMASFTPFHPELTVSDDKDDSEYDTDFSVSDYLQPSDKATEIAFAIPYYKRHIRDHPMPREVAITPALRVYETSPWARRFNKGSYYGFRVSCFSHSSS